MAERDGGGFFARWERYWFGEASLLRLALFRIVLMAAAFDGVWVVRRAVFQHAAGVSESYARSHWRAIYAFELLGIGPPSLELARVAWVLVLVAIVCGIVGLFTRLACLGAAVGTLYWVGCEYSFGKPHHTCVALVFGLFALPLAPVGARLSLDGLVRRLGAAARGQELVVPMRAPWAALPLHLTQITVAVGYLFSGLSKLAIGGWAWPNGYTLMGIMVEYRSPWSEHFYGSQPLLVLLSLGLLGGQLGFVLVFLGPVWRWIFVPIAVSFHVMAMKTMGTGAFLTLWLALSCFVALEQVPEFLARFAGSGPPWRRALFALGFSALAYQTVAIYTSSKPAWLAWVLLPVGVVLLCAALPRLMPVLEVRFDPRSRRARLATAALMAGNWAGRLASRAAVAEEGRWSLADSSGTGLHGARTFVALLLRLPPVWFLVPLALALGG
jgi:hypothetical protein